MAIKDDIQSAENSNQEEIQEPLILQHQKSLKHGGRTADEAQTSRKESLWMVYLSTFVAVCGSYEFGTCVGYSSPTQAAIIEDLGLSVGEYSVFGSILTVGAMIGAVTSGPIADFVGRKGAMRVAAAFCFIGWLAIYFAKEPMLLDFGRLTNGFGMGVFSYVVPVLIAEISPKNLRGALTTLNQVMICSGVSISFVIGTVVTWRTLALIGIIPCGIVILGLFLIPESPRWLAKKGYQKEFIDALQKLRGRDADISQESTEIQEYIETLDRLPKATLVDLFQRRYLSSVTIGVGLMVFQQFGGINGICFYVSSIFESAGRIHVYIGSFSAGMGAVPWVVMSEIFPINIKGKAGSLATLVNWFGAWAVSYTYNYLISWSSYGTFVLYAAVNALAIAFVIKVVPETKGKTLEQIQAAINS
uniref:Major facilitator superfamily (MFS) profile domain-containing protein n=1 Tax=Kalanchoe fedtschenkoi TaxID=63787 RepID=A0A7N0TUP6_KALFE